MLLGEEIDQVGAGAALVERSLGAVGTLRVLAADTVARNTNCKFLICRCGS